MKTYKVEYDKETRKITVHWYDEEGNECQGDYGTYKITIPANTFMWYGDNVNCEGREGNDEFVYTFTIAETAPKPVLKGYVDNNNIIFVVENGAIEKNYQSLGYKTYNTMSSDTIRFNNSVDVISTKYNPICDVSRLGYSEEKPVITVALSQEGIEPLFEYVVSFADGGVANSGLGEKYDQKYVYNEAVSTKFTGTPEPDYAVSQVDYDYSNQKVTVRLSTSDTRFGEKTLYRSVLDNNSKPFLTNIAGTVTAYCDSVTLAGSDIVCVMSIKNQDDFTVGTSTTGRFVKFNIDILAGWINNYGDGYAYIGHQKNLEGLYVYAFPLLESVPEPEIASESRTPKTLVATWNNIYGSGYTTAEKSQPRFVAKMKDGSTVDLSSYMTVQMPTNKDSEMTVVYDTSTNFGLNPEDVSIFSVICDEAIYENTGDNTVYSGVSDSVAYEYDYQPVDCKPVLDFVKTNVNPLYPVVSGDLLTALHVNEITTFDNNSITITDANDNVLMSWKSTYEFNKITSDTTSPIYRIESLSDNTVSGYVSDVDDQFFEMDEMYSKDGAYEQYHGNVIKLKADKNKFWVEGDGIGRLGKLTGITNTPLIKKYVLEVETTSFITPWYCHWTETGIVTGNVLGGFVDWKSDAFAVSSQIPLYQGHATWGFNGTGDSYVTCVSGGSLYSDMGFSPFSEYCFKHLWSKTLYNQTTNADLKSYISDYASDDRETEYANKYWYYYDLQKWFDNVWLKDNPIVFTGETGTEGTPTSYTNCIGWYSMQKADEQAVFYDWNSYFYRTHINNMFSMYQVSATTDNTYSFLYDTPSDTWRFGLALLPYNVSSRQYGSPIISLNKIDTSRQSNFDYFMYQQAMLHGIPAELDLSQAVSCNYMFTRCAGEDEYNKGYWFNAVLNTKDTLANVKSANYMYDTCQYITSVNDQFSFASLISGNYMFNDCRSLSALPSSFNPTLLEYANSMFAVNGNYKEDRSRYYKIDGTYIRIESNPTTGICRFLYYDTENDDFTNTENEYTIDVLPQSAFNFTTVYPTWESVSNIKEAEYMWYNRRQLTSVPMKWNFSSLYDGIAMFSECVALKKIPTAWTSTDELLSADSMFYDCESLTGIHSGFQCKNLESAKSMFALCNFSQINDDFQPNNVSYTDAMFAYCENFNTIPASWTTIENISTSPRMFIGCSALTELPDTWTVCNSTNTEGMFEGTGLKVVDTEFPCIAHCLGMFVESEITASTGVLNVGNYCDGTGSNSAYLLNHNQYIFRIKDYGMIENLYEKEGTRYTKYAMSLSFNNLDIPTEESDIDNLVESVFYLLDNLWSGTTVVNPQNANAPKYKNYTSDRLAYSYANKDSVEIFFSEEMFALLKEKLLAQMSEHTTLTQQLLNEKYNGGGSYNPKTAYSLKTVGY